MGRYKETIVTFEIGPIKERPMNINARMIAYTFCISIKLRHYGYLMRLVKLPFFFLEKNSFINGPNVKESIQ